ncbi:MAG: 23S rRNA (adenine(2503)-C(2))-methyltransferase RlmN [candidate division Zixibacteria bacterium]|nr:23S rRNA (adenine(2503)-C(2))-methyltransferase RlmN [candidate division Zixibacteria bacterium]
MKKDIIGYDIKMLEDTLEELGELRFRGRQVANWMYKHGVRDFMKMVNISSTLRAKLDENLIIGKLKLADKQSDETGTEKFLWNLNDGETIESVLIPDGERLTLCISSQVGCPLDCQFCATGQIGFKRNLNSGEIVNQYLQADTSEERRITNIVFMGMGEPLLNYENLLTALRIFISDEAIAFGAKKITVSTSGVAPKIKKLAEEGMKTGLAFSLNAADDKLRDKLMPINRRYNLEDNLKALKHYAKLSGRRVTFEYVLIKNVNDSLDDAGKLAKMVHGIPCKINLIRYNPVDGTGFEAPDDDAVLAFRDYLYPRAPAVTLRESKGSSIAAACGQLRGEYVKNELGSK